MKKILIIVGMLIVIAIIIQQSIIKQSSSVDNGAAVVRGIDFEAITRFGMTTVTGIDARPITFPNPLNLPIIDDENDCPICQDSGVSTPAPADQFGAKRSERDARAKLEAAGVKVNKPAPATQLNDMPDKALDAMIAIKTKSGAETMVTGGTEPGHASHGCGLPIFDLRKNPTLDAYLRGGKAVGMTKFGNTKYSRDDFIPGYTLECTEELNKPKSAGSGWASHWHCRLIAKSCQAPTKSTTESRTKVPVNTLDEIRRAI
jgi:hypothetical protein